MLLQVLQTFWVSFFVARCQADITFPNLINYVCEHSYNWKNRWPNPGCNKFSFNAQKWDGNRSTHATQSISPTMMGLFSNSWAYFPKCQTNTTTDVLWCAPSAPSKCFWCQLDKILVRKSSYTTAYFSFRGKNVIWPLHQHPSLLVFLRNLCLGCKFLSILPLSLPLSFSRLSELMRWGLIRAAKCSVGNLTARLVSRNRICI